MLVGWWTPGNGKGKESEKDSDEDTGSDSDASDYDSDEDGGSEDEDNREFVQKDVEQRDFQVSASSAAVSWQDGRSGVFGVWHVVWYRVVAARRLRV